ncbi:hypothetical protein JRQ81_017289 [Phrynocephalus forsythii]|uniref:Phenazine biosynthesis-like domain-containing protein n=1 Tax=Phrynocephalus forsythii TaxID=171643 RepID=A0A9Q1AZI0_9SAUR|nr:hypothetical protein JRQ81_017289 [Phrynocephalus forsythii]
MQIPILPSMPLLINHFVATLQLFVFWKICLMLSMLKSLYSNYMFLVLKTENVNSTLTFVTLSGELKARQAGDHITLDLPLYFSHPQHLQAYFVLFYHQVAVSDMAIQDLRYSPETKKLLVRLSDVYEKSDLEKLKVNAQELMLAEKTGKIKGLIVTLKGDGHGKQGRYDFFSRYFAPWYGVSEDPVTGAAHTVLSSYWSQQLGKRKSFQCSARGGKLKILLRDDGRLDLGGQTAIVLKGFLTIEN